MTTKRNPVGSVPTEDSGSIRRSIACTHGPQARKRSATDWSVMDSYSAVKVPATSRKGLSKPQYKKTTRKSCSGVLTFLARPKAVNSRAICAVSGGRSCKSSSKSVSGSVRGNGMVCFSCGREGPRFPPCSMPSFSPIYSLSWRLWVDTLGLVLAMLMTGAGLDDGVAAPQLLEPLDPCDFPRLSTIFADQKYHNHALDAWMTEHRAGWRIEVKTRPEGTKGFTPLEKRWVIERTNAWHGRYHRNSKDYERSTESSTAMIQISNLHLMLNRISPCGRPAFHYRKEAA